MAVPQEITEQRKQLGRSLATYRNAAGYTQQRLAKASLYARSTVANVETGRQNVPRRFWELVDKLLNANGALVGAYEQLEQTVCASRLNSVKDWNGAHDSANVDDVDRRRFFAVGAGMAGLLAADSAPSVRRGVEVSGLLASITRPAAPSPPCSEADMSLNRLTERVAAAKRHYQNCRYQLVVDGLPGLLGDLSTAADAADGDLRRLIQVLAADAWQVAASVLLKHDDTALAAVAADRSMTASHASGDPTSIAASSRAVVHSLTRTGRQADAADLATDQATTFDRHIVDDATLSVQGALLLRGASSAAAITDRGKTAELLDAASDCACRLASGGNHKWTGFNVVNVQLHRVHAALQLGDAGHAVELAAGIRLGDIRLAERRVSLAIDLAGAYAQWGKHDKALHALHVAESIAPEETRTRAAVGNIVNTLDKTGPDWLRPHVRQYAVQLAHAA